MKLRWLAPFALGVLSACAGNTIEEGPSIRELAANKEKTAPDTLPVVKSEQVGPSTDKALENYEKLLNLPQDPATRAETMRRLADLQLDADDAAGGAEKSEERIRQSIALYNLLLAEHPDAPGNDRVLYQLARAHQSVGAIAQAETALQRLTQEFPQSSYADDAHFRRAELLFRLSDYEQAESEYRYVMERKDHTPFFQTAQYKLGWSLFKQSKYESALPIFYTVLDRELPQMTFNDPQAALEAVPAARRDLAKDAMRVASLSLAYLGGGEAANAYFVKNGEPRYSTALYNALGELLLEKKRYTDAADAFRAFILRHPKDSLAPAFQSRAITAQEAGGFAGLAVAEKERYVKTFDPAAAYWAGAPASPLVLVELRKHLEFLGRHQHAKTQQLQKDSPDNAEVKPGFLVAAGRYRRLLEIYPQDPQAAAIRFLLGETLYEGGETLQAATEYERVATEYPGYEKAPEAAYAAVLAYQRRVQEVPDAQKSAALRKAADAGLTLAERYPDHPQRLTVLTRCSEDLYRLQDWDQAIRTAAVVLKAQPAAANSLRLTALTVTADAMFALKRYAGAEQAYALALDLTALDVPGRRDMSERMAAAIYKQGEAARTAGNPRQAAENFLRVGRRVPAASIRATADYDAAAALIALKDWPAAATVLEGFRLANPDSKLLPEVDKKLAVIYQSADQPQKAVTILQRIAARTGESAETRREAAWLAASLLDQARDGRAALAYESYLKDFPAPPDRAMDARLRLAQLADAANQQTVRLKWLNELIAADLAAGAARTDHSRHLAADATLVLGRMDAGSTSRIPLKLPLKKTLSARKQAMDRAVDRLNQAAAYGFADVTTAATYELGLLYQDLSRSLLESERPRNLSALEREQYTLLLEEQAFPFEEKAIEWHESNLKRVNQGLYNEWVGKSVSALAQMAPARYGKREQGAEYYDAFR